MAEMTQEIYSATGTTGNKTYYRSNGKTIAREVLTPMSPPTNAQTIRRRILAQVEHSRHRSVCNFAVNLLGAIAAYCYFPKKPTIQVARVFDNQLTLF